MLEGGRVTGVEYVRDGRVATARAARQVVLAAGAIGTPQIMMLSGLGPAAHLGEHGIEVVRDLPGVGANLQDHLQIRTSFRISGARTLNDLQAGLWGKASIAAQYALSRSGPMAMAPSQLGLFTRSHPRYATPNIEFHVQPLSLDAFGEPLHPYPAVTVSVCNLRPNSIGIGAARLGGFSRCARHRAELSVRRRGPRRGGRLDQAGAPADGDEAHGGVRAGRRRSRARRSRATRNWRRRRAASPPRSSTRSARRRWGRKATRWRWSIRGLPCAASAG